MARYPETAIIAPWISAIMAGADDDDPAARARGLADDCAVAVRCDGIVLVGGRISAGMTWERDAVAAAGLEVVDLTELGEEPPT
jgi:hypothetical protein